MTPLLKKRLSSSPVTFAKALHTHRQMRAGAASKRIARRQLQAAIAALARGCR